MQSLALVPQLISDRPSRAADLAIVGGGVLLLGALAQISIPLPFTPVPITGQTFGVALMALSFGRRLGGFTMLSYLGLGALGVPLFAGAQSGITFGPTFGYLVGMLLASLLMGELADRGFTKTLRSAWLAAFCGSGVVFLCGLVGLSCFIGTHHLLEAGLFPFLPGDILKTGLAAAIASQAQRFHK